MADGSASCASAVSIRPSVCAFFLQPINAHCIQLHQWGLFRAYRPTVTQSAAYPTARFPKTIFLQKPRAGVVEDYLYL